MLNQESVSEICNVKICIAHILLNVIDPLSSAHHMCKYVYVRSHLKDSAGIAHTGHRRWVYSTAMALTNEQRRSLTESILREITSTIEEQHAALLSKLKVSCAALAAPMEPAIPHRKEPPDCEQPAAASSSWQLCSASRMQSFWWEASLMPLEQRLIHIQAQICRIEQQVSATPLLDPSSKGPHLDMPDHPGASTGYQNPSPKMNDVDRLPSSESPGVGHAVEAVLDASTEEINPTKESHEIDDVKLPSPTWLDQLSAVRKRWVDRIQGVEKTRFEARVENNKFELLFGVVIVVNAMFIALELQYSGLDIGFSLRLPQYRQSAEERLPGGLVLLKVAEIVFTIVFTIELVLRMLALRLKFIIQLWNWLDVIIVILALLDTLDLLSGTNATVIRLMRLGKLTRLIRMLGVASYFDSFFFLERSLRSSFGILFWSVFMLFIVQAIVGVVIGQSLRDIMEDVSIPEDVRREVFMYWGTFSRTMLTMFEITLGNWVPSCRLLVEEVSEWFTVIYLLYRCAVGFGMMGVITAVFVQKTKECATEDESLALKEQARNAKRIEKKLRKLFHSLDTSGDGVLTRDEFMSLVQDPTVLPWLKLLEVDLDDLDKLFHALDDGDGNIEADEFIQGLQQMKGPAHRMDVVHLHKLCLKICHRLDEIDASKPAAATTTSTCADSQSRNPHLHSGLTLWSRKIELCAD